MLLVFILLSILCATTGCHVNMAAYTGPSSTRHLRKPLADNSTGESLDNFRTFRGLFEHGHEARSFTPCEEKTSLWIYDQTKGQFLKAYTALSNTPYQPVFMEVKGTLAKPPTDGFGADYDGAIVIKEVLHASRVGEGWGCRERFESFLFKAQGNEPGWTVQVAKDGITFSSIQLEKPLSFPLVQADDNHTTITFATKSATAALSLNLTHGLCIDTMSGERFGWKASLTLNDTNYTGCARQGDQHP